MPDPACEIHDVHVQSLHQLMQATILQVKTLHATLGALMADVAALRRTVLQEPEDVLAYKNNLNSTLETARPLVDEAMRSYEDMIRQIGESEELTN
jgi:hypothetical protein